MNGDGFSRLVKLMREQGAKYNNPGIFLAEVVSPQPNLEIRIGNVIIDKDNILIADYLLKDYEREMKYEGAFDPIALAGGLSFSASTVDVPPSLAGTTNTGTVVSLDVINANSSAVGKLTYRDSLKKGDVLAVLSTTDYQKYICLAKVVSL